jgi:hypothetical protein
MSSSFLSGKHILSDHEITLENPGVVFGLHGWLSPPSQPFPFRLLPQPPTKGGVMLKPAGFPRRKRGKGWRRMTNTFMSSPIMPSENIAKTPANV